MLPPEDPPKKTLRKGYKSNEDPLDVTRVYAMLGNTLRHVRERRGLTHEDLAMLIDGSASTISQYERGLRTPSVITMLRIARACETPFSSIYASLDRVRLPPLRPIEDSALAPKKRRKWK